MKKRIPFQKFHIQTYTEGEGESILFLHGWPTNAGLWDAQAEELSKDFTLHRIDWLGFGQSDKPSDIAYTFSLMKDCLSAVLDNLLEKDEKISLIAHDIGGPPSLLWASEHPERVKRLILLNTVLYPLKTPLDALSEIILGLPILKN
ncbi:MAG: alpha/beta fold hydrolase, partial [Bacteroidota bacterium]